MVTAQDLDDPTLKGQDLVDAEHARFDILADNQDLCGALITFNSENATQTNVQVSIRNSPTEYLFHSITALIMNISENNEKFSMSMIMNQVYANINEAVEKKENHES